MNDNAVSQDFALEPVDNARLANLCGQFDEHLRLVERRLGVEISSAGNRFRVIGEPPAVAATEEVLRSLYHATRDEALNPMRVHLLLREADAPGAADDGDDAYALVRTKRVLVRARGVNQKHYLRNLATHDINFGIGPAGTGKTYLAVASAVDALERERVRRVVLVRPAVEAGERLGFLPGDLAQKVDPYLRPLYDALYEMLGFEKVGKLLERNVIEVAPLAYMRGRTLNESFIILDEAQNTTVEQMKMFLTRIGFGSTAAITGDVTQVDLPGNRRSGLRHVIEILQGIKGIAFTFFNSRDVVRHPLVQAIIDAYDAGERLDRDRDPSVDS